MSKPFQFSIGRLLGAMVSFCASTAFFSAMAERWRNSDGPAIPFLLGVAAAHCRDSAIIGNTGRRTTDALIGLFLLVIVVGLGIIATSRLFR